MRTLLPQTQLLLAFAIPKTDLPDASAQVSAANFAEQQCWGEYEVRRAKRYEGTLPDGRAACRYEVWGTFDTKKLTEMVLQRLQERAAAAPAPEKT